MPPVVSIRRRTRRRVASFAAVVVCAASCAVDPPVAVEESNRSAGDLVSGDEGGGPPTDGGVEAGLPVVEAPATSVEWGSCDDFAIPDDASLGTSGWECGMLIVPMDPFGDVADPGDVELALTRHAATGDRRGSILLNPGGPGGAGLPTAWSVRGGMPLDMLRSFDIVAWDPRGVGQSRPGIQCDESLSGGDPDFIAVCVERTGPLSEFLGAPYSAADMEAIRVALGERQLDYLGFSYGSVLGATFAAEYPSSVGAFVLDGVTDPLAGSANGPMNGTFAVFADDGFPAARDRFVELCDASQACLPGLSAADTLDALADEVSDLRTDDFAGAPERVDADAYFDFLDTTVSYAGDWELVATALGDAADGDASALAAMIAGNSGRDGGGDGDASADPDDTTTFSEANFMIYCADFGPLLVDATFCDDMPVNRRSIEPIREIGIERDILLIGTEFDPLTPGYHAPEFRDALGDATHVIWEGVGHTAFPGWTACIDDVVADQFLRRQLPPDGTRCSFLEGAVDDAQTADELFGVGDLESKRMLEGALERSGVRGDEQECAADAINQFDAQVINHVILDVTSEVASDAVRDAIAAC